MRARLICSMISSKCAALFPESLIITIYNLHKEIWYCKNCHSKSFKTKRSQKSSQTCHFNSTFVINRYFTDFFCQWKSTKICRKAKHDILLHISCLFGQKRTITQGTSAPEDYCPGGILAKKIFPQETFVQKNPLCQGDPFFSKKISTSLEPLCNKEHPMTKHVVWGRVLTKQKSDTWWLF